MSFKVLARVDKDLSVDPSYIVRYQVFENNSFIGDGVAQYHRLACDNDINIPDYYRLADGRPLPGHLKNPIKDEIKNSVSEILP
jgi:hypothetical protein